MNFTPEECSRHPSVCAVSSRWDSNLFSFRKISVQETLLSLKNLNPNKAVGFDMIPPHVLKIAAEELAGPLTEIINQCILEKYWPSSLKKGEWIPAFKKEDPLEMSNYRPITILTVVDKIFEQLLSKQMSKFFEPIFDPFVSAYRGLYSCESTLVRLVEDWKQAIDTGKTVGVLSTDMSKAFDTMHPTLLLAKLQAYGFSNESLTLMRSFFMDRKGRTKLGAVVSDWIACSRLSDSRENEKNCV